MTSVFPGLLRTGSHVQALFKGQRDREFAWFALGSATPLTSASAERAAREIIRACRYGTPQIVISVQAKFMILANALFPNLAAAVSSTVNQTLPAAGAPGDALPGRNIRGKFPPAALTVLPDQASRTNNELGE